jgi:hypothetical protein
VLLVLPPFICTASAFSIRASEAKRKRGSGSAQNVVYSPYDNAFINHINAPAAAA